MGRWKHHKYEYSKPFGHARHRWTMICSKGAIEFHASVHEEHGDTAGLEIHYKEPPDYMKNDAPSILDCKLTGGHCWADGTSMYAMETLWPIIKAMLRSQDHEAIFSILEKDGNSRFFEEN